MSLLFILFFFNTLAEEQWRVLEFVNKCEHQINVVSVINPNPALLPPNDPVCHATDTCRQKNGGGGCPCSAGVIASVAPGSM